MSVRRAEGQAMRLVATLVAGLVLAVAAHGERFGINPGLHARRAHPRPGEAVKTNVRTNRVHSLHQVCRQLVAGGFSGNDHNVHHSAR